MQGAWSDFFATGSITNDVTLEDRREIDNLFTVILLAEELGPGGYADQTLRSQEIAEERSHWLPRRMKPASDRKFSEVIGQHFASDALFKRYFRMNRDCFNSLCSDLCGKVGKEVFRPESSLGGGGEGGEDYRGAVKRQGGIVCGEVRVAVCIRLLVGASYLDLMVIFNLSHRSIFRCFHMVVEWINTTLSYPLFKALVDMDHCF